MAKNLLKPLPRPPASARTTRGYRALGAVARVEPCAPALYVVSTPIGNLGDVTLRALETLAGADVVFAEDTRVSRKLLDHFAIETPLRSYHEHNAEAARPEILQRLATGEAVALISDAGTPLISDPGYKLAVEAIAAGHKVIAAPGASALLAALASAGLPTDRFFFEGFLPAKSGARRARINAIAAIEATLIFYEAPSRLAESLADLALELGSRPAAVARELTKLYEEIRRGRLDQLAAHYAEADAPRGEIVIVVGPPEEQDRPEPEEIDRQLREAMQTASVKDAAAAVAARCRLPRRDVYARALILAGERK